MPTVVGIRFRDSGKVYFFDPGGLELQLGELAVVETVRGLELGKVAREAHDVRQEDVVGEMKRVLRRPNMGDFERMQHLSARQKEALTACSERIAEHSLPMRLVKAEYNFDGTRLTFYFTAESRVDFRALVRDLARTFRTRIELRQVGPRDGAKLLGGIGPCGRPLCCATFLPDFARVSIKMAKDQDLPLNPSKISGVCGRLLCCLSYEHEQYQEIKAELPHRGHWVQTPEGPGEVVAVNVIRETVTVDIGNSGNLIEVNNAQIAAAGAAVSGEARSRAEAGIAAPATREQPRGPRGPQPVWHAPGHGDEELDLRALVEDETPQPMDDLVRYDQSLGDAPPTTPHLRTRDQQRRQPQGGPAGQQRQGQGQGYPRQRDQRDQRDQQRRPQPDAAAGRQRQGPAAPRAAGRPGEQPTHRLTEEGMELKSLPSLHGPERGQPEEGEGRSRRRRRRRGGGGGTAAGGMRPREEGQSSEPGAPRAQQTQAGQQGGGRPPRREQQPGQRQERRPPAQGGQPGEAGEGGEQRPPRHRRRR